MQSGANVSHFKFDDADIKGEFIKSIMHLAHPTCQTSQNTDTEKLDREGSDTQGGQVIPLLSPPPKIATSLSKAGPTS